MWKETIVSTWPFNTASAALLAISVENTYTTLAGVFWAGVGSGAVVWPWEGVEDLGAVAVDGVMECGVCWESWDFIWSAELHSKRINRFIVMEKLKLPFFLPAFTASQHKPTLRISRRKYLAKRKTSFLLIKFQILFSLNDSL